MTTNNDPQVVDGDNPAPAAPTSGADPQAPDNSGQPPATPPQDPPAAPPADAGDGNPPADAPSGAPESYADFTLPDNYTVGDSVMSSYVEAAREANLSQDAAQQLLTKLTTAHAEQQKADQSAATEFWEQESRADPDVGGDKFDASKASALAAAKRFGGDALTQLLSDSGLINELSVLRAFKAVHDLVGEDSTVVTGKASDSGDLTGDEMYPVMAQQKRANAR